MSLTQALIFDKVQIGEPGDTSNYVDYSPHLSESAEVTIEPVEQTVLNNQTLPSAWDVSFTVDLLNSAITADANIYSNSSNNYKLADIKFVGTAGAANLVISNVIVLATPNFEGERTAYTLSGSKRVTTVPTAVTVE